MQRTAATYLLAACILIGLAGTASARPVIWPTFGPVAAVSAPGAPSMPADVDPTTAVNPTKVEFSPSPNHNDVSPLDGTALVTRYELRVYPQGQTTVAAIQDLLKPAPANGVIDVTLDPAAVVSKLATDALYVARVAAIGPRGEGVSGLSNPFGFAGTTPPGAPSTVGIKK
jgi:hypothetical protein